MKKRKLIMIDISGVRGLKIGNPIIYKGAQAVVDDICGKALGRFAIIEILNNDIYFQPGPNKWKVKGIQMEGFNSYYKAKEFIKSL